MKQNCVDLEYKKYPAQMLEVAGDLRRAPAKFENPVMKKKAVLNEISEQLYKFTLNFLE